MRFAEKYPVPLQELLVAPVVLRDGRPWMSHAPHVSNALLVDLASAWGHSSGAIRTALSRLRSSGALQTHDDDGVACYRTGSLAKSITQAVARRAAPEAYVLAIFSFSSEDVTERRVVRDALKLHGFQKLAQNVYINGDVDVSEIERTIREARLSRHVFFFRSPDEPNPTRDERLIELFGVTRRARELARFRADLEAFLDEPGLDAHEYARRYVFAAPTHYRITFVEEPPLPRRCLPDDYPLAKLLAFGEPPASKRNAIVSYLSAF